MCNSQAVLKNIRLHRKGHIRANTLAYLAGVISDKGKKVFNIDIWFKLYKTFFVTLLP
jgi:hypothetical protein